MKDQLLKSLQSANVPASIILRADFTIGIFNASTFPNIGQLIFNRGDVPCLVLDSHASVTNMLEGTVQLPGTEAPVFKGLPYVKMVNQNGGYEATSLTLPHRLGSGYLAKNKMAMLGGNRYDKQLLGEIKDNGLHLTMLRYCPMSLLHGAWFAQMSGNHKVAKSVGGRLVAENVTLAQVGGTLMDRVRQESKSLDLSSFEKEEADGDAKSDGKGDRASKLGIGMIPHDGKRYSADRVVGEFFINYGQINSFKIPECGKDLLKALAVYEVYAFLATVPMHRSDCQMTLNDVSLNADIMLGGKQAVSLEQAKMAVESAISQCVAAKLFAGVSEVMVELKNKPEEKKVKGGKKDAAVPTDESVDSEDA